MQEGDDFSMRLMKQSGKDEITGAFNLYHEIITHIDGLTHDQLNDIRDVKDRLVRRTKCRHGLDEFAYSPARAEINAVVTAREQPIQLVKR